MATYSAMGQCAEMWMLRALLTAVIIWESFIAPYRICSLGCAMQAVEDRCQSESAREQAFEAMGACRMSPLRSGSLRTVLEGTVMPVEAPAHSDTSHTEPGQNLAHDTDDFTNIANTAKLIDACGNGHTTADGLSDSVGGENAVPRADMRTSSTASAQGPSESFSEPAGGAASLPSSASLAEALKMLRASPRVRESMDQEEGRPRPDQEHASTAGGAAAASHALAHDEAPAAATARSDSSAQGISPREDETSRSQVTAHAQSE